MRMGIISSNGTSKNPATRRIILTSLTIHSLFVVTSLVEVSWGQGKNQVTLYLFFLNNRCVVIGAVFSTSCRKFILCHFDFELNAKDTDNNINKLEFIG